MDEMPAWARFIPLGLLLITLISVPFMCRSESAEVAAPVTAQAVQTTDGTARSERFRAPKDGLITVDQINMYIAVRERARALRDQRLTARQSTSSVDRDAVDELDFEFDEYQWVRNRIDEVRRMDVSSGRQRRVETNFAILNAHRAELREIGLILPPSEEFFRATNRMRAGSFQDRVQNDHDESQYPPYDYQEPEPQSQRDEQWSTTPGEMGRQEAEAHRQLQEWQQRKP